MSQAMMEEHSLLHMATSNIQYMAKIESTILSYLMQEINLSATKTIQVLIR
jgi:hypothetical protein